MKHLLIVFAALFTFLACETPIYFEEPQPQAGKIIKTFKKRLQGRYKDVGQAGAFLIIEKNKIQQEIHWQAEVTLSGIDTLEGYQWNGKQLTINGTPYQSYLSGDTIHFESVEVYTFFDANLPNELRQYQDFYFLNKKEDNGYKVWKLAVINNRRLVLSEIKTSEEIKKLQTVTQIDSVLSDSSETVQYYKTNPSSEEFDVILNGDFFSAEAIYEKID